MYMHTSSLTNSGDVPSGVLHDPDSAAQSEHRPTSRQAPLHVTTGYIDQNAVATLGVPLGNTFDAVFHVLIWRTVGVRSWFSIGEGNHAVLQPSGGLVSNISREALEKLGTFSSTTPFMFYFYTTKCWADLDSSACTVQAAGSVHVLLDNGRAYSLHNDPGNFLVLCVQDPQRAGRNLRNTCLYRLTGVLLQNGDGCTLRLMQLEAPLPIENDPCAVQILRRHEAVTTYEPSRGMATHRLHNQVVCTVTVEYVSVPAWPMCAGPITKNFQRVQDMPYGWLFVQFVGAQDSIRSDVIGQDEPRGEALRALPSWCKGAETLCFRMQTTQLHQQHYTHMSTRGSVQMNIGNGGLQYMPRCLLTDCYLDTLNTNPAYTSTTGHPPSAHLTISIGLLVNCEGNNKPKHLQMKCG